MDEPFSGLDPINVGLLKEAVREMRRRGKTIIFCTHQLEQVEELCEDIILINKGREMLFGERDRDPARIRAECGAPAPRQRSAGGPARFPPGG
jgi:ABC-type uncharacterized transport system ATPase subunit